MAETPNEIIGVIAHEAGHIAGGHQQRLREQLARAKTMAIIATLLGAGAMVAGAATDSRGLAGAGMGVAAGGGEMAQRGLLGYQRTEETTADRSAITYLEATGQSGMGMLKTFGASRARCPCPARRSTPTRSAIRCRATASPISKRWSSRAPIRQGRSAGAAAAARHDARQDRRLHAGSGRGLAPVPQESRQPCRALWRGAGSAFSMAIRARARTRPTR